MIWAENLIKEMEDRKTKEKNDLGARADDREKAKCRRVQEDLARMREAAEAQREADRAAMEQQRNQNGTKRHHLGRKVCSNRHARLSLTITKAKHKQAKQKKQIDTG